MRPRLARLLLHPQAPVRPCTLRGNSEHVVARVQPPDVPDVPDARIALRKHLNPSVAWLYEGL
jgi:hypothetical protein